MEIVKGGVTAAKGYKVSSAHAGLKKLKKDMAMVVSEKDAVYAGTFTTNKVKAAPVIWDMKINEKGVARAIVVNSGNANACTGSEGLKDTEITAEKAAALIGTDTDKVLVCSTGVIGVRLDMDKILSGVGLLSEGLSEENAHEAAEAICTTDTFAKEAAASCSIQGRTVTVGGMCKGSGMIHPNMATMLCFVTTDVAITKPVLQRLLGKTIEDTFNMVSVDGDTSTNDTCLVLANGLAGNEELEEGTEDYEVFAETFRHVLGELARMIARDGEGAGKFIEMKVVNAMTEKDAKLLARSVISSSLVKAAFFGADANWGRVLCAMGYSGADFDPDLVDLRYLSSKGELYTLIGGVPLVFDEDKAKEILLENEITVIADCHQGTAEATAWGCDLTYDYVRINGDYRS